MSQRPIVKLGSYWSSFSRPHENLQMLGTIQQGAAIGALALDAEGRYLQVNGDVVRELNTSRVEAALRSAQSRLGHQAIRPRYIVGERAAVADASVNVARAPATTPTVTFVKRRRIVIPQT